MDLVAHVQSGDVVPAGLDLDDATVVESNERDRGVLRGHIGAHEPVSPGQNLDGAMLVAEEPSPDRDAVAAETAQRPAAHALRVPRVLVRVPVRFARPDREHVADRSGVDELLGLHQPGREHLGLGIAVPDSRRLHGLQAAPRLGRVPAERLRADDGLAGGGDLLDGGDVQVVRECDDHQVDVVACHELRGRRNDVRDPVAFGDLAALGLRARSQHGHIVTAHMLQRPEVEIGHEPSAHDSNAGVCP